MRKGMLIAAIETIAVAEQQQAAQITGESEKEVYIGGYQVLHSKSPGGARVERCGSHPITSEGLWYLCNKPKVVCYPKPRF